MGQRGLSGKNKNKWGREDYNPEPYLKLQRVQDEVADDVVLALEQERDARGHEVPDEHLVVVERAGVVRVARCDRPHGAAAVPHHRLPEQLPPLVLHRAGALPLCVRFGRARAAVDGPPQAHIADLGAGVVVVRSRVGHGVGAPRGAAPPNGPAVPWAGCCRPPERRRRGRRAGWTRGACEMERCSDPRDRHEHSLAGYSLQNLVSGLFQCRARGRVVARPGTGPRSQAKRRRGAGRVMRVRWRAEEGDGGTVVPSGMEPGVHVSATRLRRFSPPCHACVTVY